MQIHHLFSARANNTEKIKNQLFLHELGEYMSKFHKRLSKYTKTYKKKILKGEFTDEEKLVFLTVGLSAVNSLIYFVGGLKEASSNYAGFKTKAWGIALNEITENNVHSILESFFSMLKHSSNQEG